MKRKALLLLAPSILALAGCGGSFFPAPKLTSIALAPSSVMLSVGDVQPFVASGTYSDGSIKDVSKSVVWATTDRVTIGIEPNGVSIANAVGTANITATQDGIVGTTPVTVGN